jgi:hypothetical protein
MADPRGRSTLPPLPSLEEPLYVITARPEPRVRKKAAAPRGKTTPDSKPKRSARTSKPRR